MFQTSELLDIKQASRWASKHLGKDVTPSNITYLINYGRITKLGDNNKTLVAKQDLIEYYEENQKELVWKNKLGKDLN